MLSSMIVRSMSSSVSINSANLPVGFRVLLIPRVAYMSMVGRISCMSARPCHLVLFVIAAFCLSIWHLRFKCLRMAYRDMFSSWAFCQDDLASVKGHVPYTSCLR